MAIRIILDTREHHLYGILSSSSTTVLSKQLDVGDVHFVDSTDNILCVIERKTVSDYISSISDKRSKEQNIRLKAFRSEQKKNGINTIIMYIIEGNLCDYSINCEKLSQKNALFGSMLNKIVRDDFIVYRTFSMSETIDFIKRLQNKLQDYSRNIQIKDNCDSNINIETEYLKSIKIAKKENMTPKNCYILQLSQIPGVSIEIAQKIAKTYPSMKDIIQAFNQLSNIKERKLMLANIRLNEKRRLGIVLSEKIYSYLNSSDGDGDDNEDNDDNDSHPKKNDDLVKNGIGVKMGNKLSFSPAMPWKSSEIFTPK